MHLFKQENQVTKNLFYIVTFLELNALKWKRYSGRLYHYWEIRVLQFCCSNNYYQFSF